MAGLTLFRSPLFHPSGTGAGGFGVSPPQVFATLAPGDSHERTINVLRSDAADAQAVRLKVNTPELAGWVALMPAEEIVFAPGDYRVTFKVRVTAPADTEPGSYYGSLTAVLKTTGKSSGVSLALGARIDLRVKVAGDGRTVDKPVTGDSPGPRLAVADSALYGRLRGFMILRPQAAGEAYYVDPDDQVIHYLPDEASAFRLLREQGIGISDRDLAALAAAGSDPAGAALRERLKGCILLAVEGAGEAYYLNPGDNERYFLGRPADAWQILKRTARGLSENDFAALTAAAP